jgi:hypothetical protein
MSGEFLFEIEQPSLRAHLYPQAAGVKSITLRQAYAERSV